MPVDRVPLLARRLDLVHRDAVPSWAVPIGAVGQTQVNLSYGVFVASSIVLTAVLIAQGQPGNADLPRAAMIGSAFWVAGWIAQLLCHTSLAWWMGLSVPSITLGLAGVESAPRRWPAMQTLVITAGTIASLVVMSAAFRWIGGGFQMPSLSPVSTPPVEIAHGMGTLPSLGMKSADALWRSAAWLCGLQVIWQLIPLPRSLGRQSVAALLAISSPRLELETRIRLLRQLLIVFAMLTLGLAMWVLSGESGQQFPRWPLLFGISVLLWLSSHRPDVRMLLVGMTTPHAGATTGSHDDGPQPVGVVKRYRQRSQDRKRIERLKAVMDNERTEAIDAARLDEVLERLHDGGQASLSDEDRAILARVSQQLRKNRLNPS
ncbi:hypothetical protein K227x_45050 [Rubripirellula lacrimiformis]|uniref:Peptidase family M50 n=1 Tax=Rubripirellula lacrimiformis TaxID=1930273 RepID=A0A517NG85_9BACT|nr:hypothetical protein [Rubripirellula lacrimiformis]QDT06098.1 hypothetical protein K227x_45050 [Rubripirellula lacrimiformis]